ncbi:S-layer homology domain-containing protein [Bacillus sp. ISL-45]|uniref:S-layer homology domain-containing protein n=1 Tax=Bacillus sp. ISL-45 TaxID=2819128 RepID=UPI001BE8A88B|nr:S-layer homology domain-containing protein [Bacillus sp. ISL-45]MBT2661569.1 S-layer homology domain-containing protein [Bacillus sp. ISL-45]
MRKKFGILALTFGLTVSSLLSYQQPKAYAQDDITGSALETEMRAMIAEKVIYGYGEGVYKPNLNVSRGQFATFISRALKLPEGPHVFSDVPLSSGLAHGINSATAAGIIMGYTPTTFGPNEQISREQAAAMIDRAFNYMQISREDAVLNFSDANEINSNFKMAVAKNSRDGLIKGLSNGDGTYRFLPKKTATRQEAAAFIYRMLNKMEEAQIPEEPGEDGAAGYKVATIQSNGDLVYSSKTYSSFDAAKTAATANNQVVTVNEQIVEMNAGLVWSKPVLGKALTYIYTDSNLSSSFTYLPAGQEMKYVDATENYVKVILAGKTVFVKHEEVSMVPLQLIEGRNYYSVNSKGELVHSIFDPVKKSYASYTMGFAPSFMVQGQNYYSWDGGQFMNTTGNVVGTAYQYFNYLPARTETVYTAEELNRYIDSVLAEKEALFISNPTTFARYKNATTASKIKGLGAYLKEAEVKHNINALLILGMAMHESDFGMSKYALERNNLFGIKAYDSNTDAAETFATPNAAIDALADRYLNKNYINPTGAHANGASTGNKARGFNVKYASDPFWGQKIAGHMHRVDLFLGKKDRGASAYRIGQTTVDGVNARINPGTESALVYANKNTGSPVAILGSVKHTDNYEWLKIMSDAAAQNEVYIRSDLIKDLPIVK